jgi:glucosamine--fructose-6-phosphate aminotransferase (isomerizing)
MTELSRSIAAQGEHLTEILATELDAALRTLEPTRRIWLVGTGTSQHAAELGGWMLAGGPRSVHAISSESFVYQAPALGPGDAVIVISHTTETAYSRQSRARAARAGAAMVAITGRGRGWPEAIETVPVETSETYTASYTATLLVLARLALALGSPGFGAAELAELPDRARAAATEPPDLGEVGAHVVALAGIGPAAITAREGALKLREAARVVAEGYEAEYLLHGSAVPLGRGDILLALEPPADASGLLTGLVDAAAGEGLATHTVREPAGLHPLLAQIPLTIRLQRLAGDLAQARGVDPDLVIVGRWARPELWAAGAPGAGDDPHARLT